MSLIDQVVSAFSSRRRPKEVPAWGITLWFAPLTQRDIDALDSRMEARYGEDKEKWPRGKRNIMLLVAKAETGEGQQAFVWGDVETLMDKADYLVLQDVIAFMFTTATGEVPKDESQGINGSDSDSPLPES